MELSTEIKEARRKLGYSQAQAANAWAIPLKTLQKWEQGIRRPQGLSLPMLRQILNATTSEGASVKDSQAPTGSDEHASPTHSIRVSERSKKAIKTKRRK